MTKFINTWWFWYVSFYLHPFVCLNGLSVRWLVLWVLMRSGLFASIVQWSLMDTIWATTQWWLILYACNLTNTNRILQISGRMMCRMIWMLSRMLWLPNCRVLLRMEIIFKIGSWRCMIVWMSNRRFIVWLMQVQRIRVTRTVHVVQICIT